MTFLDLFEQLNSLNKFHLCWKRFFIFVLRSARVSGFDIRCCMLCCLLFSYHLSEVIAQDASTPSSQNIPPDTNSSLLDGLLEWIELTSDFDSADVIELPDELATDPSARPESSADGGNLSMSRSTDEHPLLVVRDLMLAVSDTMRPGIVGEETVRLQSDVVERLDSLIKMLQSRGDESGSAERELEERMDQELMEGAEDSLDSAEDLERESDEEAEPSATKGEGDANEDGPGEDSSGPSEQPDEDSTRGQADDGEDGGTPGQGKSRPGVVAQPRDPGELQQSVWGHLPDRVRSQLEARMAEQFLPSYRAQLEAYYRALLNQERKE